jgi:hypothetical protein
MEINKVDYSKTIIYKIVCNDETVTDVYVGSTTNFKSRISCHKSKCINNYNRKIYNLINANGGWDNWTMVEVEKYSCNDFQECRKRELEIFNQLKANLNTCKPYDTDYIHSTKNKEWYSLNKDKVKQWYDDNKILKKAIADITILLIEPTSAEKRKEKYYENREAALRDAKTYYNKNKDDPVFKAYRRDITIRALERKKLAKLASEQTLLL